MEIWELHQLWIRNPIGQAFSQLAQNTVSEVNKRNAEADPTIKVEIDPATMVKTYKPNSV